MESCLYRGWVRHRRSTPLEHRFRYSLFQLYLDLEEVEQRPEELFRGRWLWAVERPAPAAFHREDYLGDSEAPLSTAVRDLVEEETGVRPEGPIRLLTHLRYLGYCFNPVSFYYCFSRDGSEVEAIVADIVNTPWGERHSYVLGRGGDREVLSFEHDKTFHVSPFIEMETRYRWRFSDPGETLVVHVDNLRRGELGEDRTGAAGAKFFDATLCLERRELSGPALAGALARFPWMTAQVVAAIYVQALRLWLKKAPFHVHPRKRPSEADPATSARGPAIDDASEAGG